MHTLDDPFSAVDAHTAAILFHDCVMDALAKKTVILVTHQVEFLSEVDKILVMESGQVTQSGIIDLYGTKIFWMNLSSSRGIQKQISTSSKARKLIALLFLRISLAYMEFKRIYEGTYLTRNQKLAALILCFTS